MYSARIDDQNERHTQISVFNRGALAGQLTVLANDADELIRRITDGAELGNTLTTDTDPGVALPADSPPGAYIELKYIPKNGRTYGPYAYMRFKQGGKLRSRYLGKVAE